MCVCGFVPVPVKRTGATPERVAPIPCVISVEWERALDRPDRGNRSWPALSKVLRCATDRNRRGCRLLDCRPANEVTRSSFYALDFFNVHSSVTPKSFFFSHYPASKAIILFFCCWQKDFTCSLSSSSPASLVAGRLLAASGRAVAVVEETCIKTGDVGETVMIRGAEVTVEGGSGDGWSRAGWLMQDGHYKRPGGERACPIDPGGKDKKSNQGYTAREMKSKSREKRG